MISISFPDMLGTYKTNTVQGKEATKSNLSLTLMSFKNTLFGDPYFGTNLNRFIYDQSNSIVRDLVIDDIYTAILAFMPQLLVRRRDISLTLNGNTVNITIQAMNKINQQIDLYSIALTGEE